jgi:hypothetical protein
LYNITINFFYCFNFTLLMKSLAILKKKKKKKKKYFFFKDKVLIYIINAYEFTLLIIISLELNYYTIDTIDILRLNYLFPVIQ